MQAGQRSFEIIHGKLSKVEFQGNLCILQNGLHIQFLIVVSLTWQMSNGEQETTAGELKKTEPYGIKRATHITKISQLSGIFGGCSWLVKFFCQG